MKTLDEVNAEVLAFCEIAAMREPEPVEPERCGRCGEFPLDDYLYKTQEGWLCAECVLQMFPKRDIYLDDWSDME